MKITRIPLLVRVLIAIVLALVCSTFLPGWAQRIAATFASLFSNFIKMFIPMLILGLVSAGIADLGRGTGKWLALTVGIAYFSTILAGTFSFFVCRGVLDPATCVLGTELAESEDIQPYFDIKMPPFVDVTTALVVSFILGICSTMTRGDYLKNTIDEFKDVVTIIISKVIVPLLPAYIFCVFLLTVSRGYAALDVMMLIKFIAIIFGMHITFILFQYLTAGAIVRVNPFKALVTMIPAYLTALATSSSAATIPVTLEQTKKNGVRSEVADFVIPLCATIHIPCSLLKIVACAYAMMLNRGMPIETAVIFNFIFMAGIVLVAAPGVPGGAIMAALAPLSTILGFTPDMLGVMIALYVIMDPFGTAGNVTGDCAIAMIIDKIRKR